MVKRLDSTDKAKKLVQEISADFGDLMFYQAGGCCEGTQPQCFEKGGYYLRSRDVCIGQVEGFDFWVDRDLFEYWKHAHFELDVTDAFGAGGFSLESPRGKSFKINYRMFTPEEELDLEPVRLAED